MIANKNPWLNMVDSTRSICELVIPGTHDTMTRDCHDNYYKTQNLALQEQLEIGVRFLDIRLTKEMVAAHREWVSTISAQTIIDTVSTFLTHNPTEFVLMRIQNTNEEKNDFLEYKHALHSVIKENRFHFLMPIETNYKQETRYRWPTIAEAKGKIVAIECAPMDFQIPWIDGKRWAYSWHQNAQIRLQDDWGGPEIKDKMQAIKELLYYPALGNDEESIKLYLNHISATNGILANPVGYAKILNPQTEKLMDKTVVCAEQRSLSKGVMIIDFIDVIFAEKVIALNSDK